MPSGVRTSWADAGGHLAEEREFRSHHQVVLRPGELRRHRVEGGRELPDLVPGAYGERLARRPGLRDLLRGAREFAQRPTHPMGEIGRHRDGAEHDGHETQGELSLHLA